MTPKTLQVSCVQLHWANSLEWFCRVEVKARTNL